MIGRPVVFLASATADIGSLDDWIAGQAGEDVAADYLDRLERFADTLSYFPYRGTPRQVGEDEIRSITFERRQVILYRTTASTVEIIRILDARRDWPRLLSG